MERILCGQQTVEADNQQKIVLYYYLIEEELAVEYCKFISYGAEVKKVVHFADGHTERECKRISNLFLSRTDAEEFVEQIVKNTVTPIGLKDVVEDYVAGRVRIVVQI